MINPNKRAPDYRDREYAVRKPRQASSVAAVPVPKNEFERYEQVMQGSFRAILDAVHTIKSRHLYRLAGYDTFEECCEKRWGWTARRGYQMLEARATIKSLPKNCEQLFKNEGQVRAIAIVPKEKRVEVLKQVSKAGPVTAKAITEAFQPAKRKVEPAVIDVEPEARKKCAACGGTGFSV